MYPVFTTGIVREKLQTRFFYTVPQLPLASHDLDDCRYLLGAALTCKKFLDPALDSLWFYIDSMLPLLRLFPSLKLINRKYVSRNVSYHHYTLKIRVRLSTVISK